MVRRILLYFEFALFAGLQIVGLASTVIGLVPAFAQQGPKPIATPAPISVAIPVQSSSNPNTIQDFMALLPASDPIGYKTADQALFDDNMRVVTAHRFYSGRKSGARVVADIMTSIVPAFTRECEAKGGHVDTRGSEIFKQTFLRFSRSGGSELNERDLTICTRSPSQSLGALAVRSTFHVSTSLWMKDFTSTTIVTLSSSIVVTQTQLDREQAAEQEARRRTSEAYVRKQAEVERWWLAIKPGTETGCGPVLRVNGEMVELVYYQIREPKWYRRSELWPERLTSEGYPTCR